ncbi:MAG: protein kinase [Methyloversatilis sp.]|jgi:serine/threonine protein kinase|uniref:protein kinase domain-containing protein n=2 Tax=Methyloversatilis TaxID=378210 RepID=UPI0025E96FFE|nr:protein kinase [Methyloversatilis sp.]MCR6664677.1 protein kinase [Methyloversatilis sp.]
MAGGPTPFGDDDEAFTEDSVNSDVLAGSGFLPTANASPGALPVGWALNEYRIESLLGGGGFGLTYLAHDTLLDCKVAVKEFLPTDIAVRGDAQRVLPRAGPAVEMFEQGLRRFLDESRALATFRHPNIVRVSRFFEANGTAYMVMDYVQGRTLNQWVRERNDAIDRTTLLAIVKPLLDGLQVVHDGGFLHRDIKPANICIRDDGTPVLLDFGAARRYHDTEHTLTAIVTPGFAPFEQYHSHGNQGPWTDIYSLAAVMYWLVTGQRPVESAARVHNDPLRPAAKAADAAIFGASLLRAIDWALEPHETRRPRSVADFRRVFMPVPAARGPLASGTPPAPAVRASGASEERRTIVCSVLYAQIDRSVDLDTAQRLACKSELDDALARAARSVDADSRLIHDTEDGAALCLLGQPEDACVVAQRLRALDLGDEGGGLRQGINLGPVRVTRAGTGALDVHGDGLDAARTLAGLARAGQVLVSRAYFETVSALGSGAPVGLHATGQRAEIASRSQEVFELDARSGITRRVDDAQPGLAQDALTPVLEALLARHIGPMARVLVTRIGPKVASPALLIEQLATHIPGDAQRAGFLIEAKRHIAGTTGVSSTVRSASIDTVSASRRSTPLTTTSRSSAFGPRPLDDALIADIEHRLARRIGPMARILVGRALKRVSDEQALLEELSRDIPDPVQRAAFLAGK